VLTYPRLHSGERIPTALAELLEPGAGVVELEAAVDGDWVMDDAQDGKVERLLNGYVAVAETAVVDDEIKVVAPLGEGAVGADREGERFGEVAGRKACQLRDVSQVLDLPEPRETPRIVVVEDLETGEPVEGYRGVELGIGGTAEHLDVVAELGEGLAHLAHVHALPADVGFTAIGEHGDSQAVV
jgi:hypothetical protein